MNNLQERMLRKQEQAKAAERNDEKISGGKVINAKKDSSRK